MAREKWLDVRLFQQGGKLLESQVHLLKVVVVREYSRDAQLLHDHNRSQIGERDPWFVSVTETQPPGRLKSVWSNTLLLNGSGTDRGKHPFEVLDGQWSRRLGEEEGHDLIQDIVGRDQTSSGFPVLFIKIEDGRMAGIFFIGQNDPPPAIDEESVAHRS